MKIVDRDPLFHDEKGRVQHFRGSFDERLTDDATYTSIPANKRKLFRLATRIDAREKPDDLEDRRKEAGLGNPH
jgi:hypothetical protein